VLGARLRRGRGCAAHHVGRRQQKVVKELDVRPEARVRAALVRVECVPLALAGDVAPLIEQQPHLRRIGARVTARRRAVRLAVPSLPFECLSSHQWVWLTVVGGLLPTDLARTERSAAE
jgi:hypothetical protein